MKNLLILTTLAMFLTACGGSTSSTNSTNSANSNVVRNTNSDSANNQAISVDPTPIKMDNDAFGKTDTKTLEGYKGRTMIVEGAIINSWSEDSMFLFANTSNRVQCNGSFSSYKDAIKKFQDHKGGWIYADVKGTVKEVEKRSETIITLENCTLLKMDK